MNIFLLDRDPRKCAEFHVDKHVVKMILEHIQLLSTACRLSGLEAGYKATHKNHPCSIWTRKSLSNWRFLKELTICLHDEWKFRFDHDIMHKSFSVMMSLPEPPIEDIGLTPFALAMDKQYVISEDAVENYRNYYKLGKIDLHSWKKRSKPEWIL